MIDMESVVKVSKGSRGVRYVTIPRKMLPKIGGAKFLAVECDETGTLSYTPLKRCDK